MSHGDLNSSDAHSGSGEARGVSTLIRPGDLPSLGERDLPESTSWRKMVGPSIILAGLSLGSGEFIIWPHLVYKAGFVFFWACVLGVVTQYFLNMEIERWTLATGETAVAGFCRLSRHWAWVFLLLNVIPWAWPGWATGAGTIVSWLAFGPQEVLDADGVVVGYDARYVPHFGIAGLLLAGLVLTAGPVVYNTVEKAQTFLVGAILVIVVGLSCLVIRPDAVAAMWEGTVSLEIPDLDATGLTMMGLLGALAFAGAGGTTNLGQSNFIKDKGYGMGRYIGRITSPVTGQEEATSEAGYHFPHTPENLSRWKRWWRAANIEHFLSFFVTCLVCLCLLTLISYSLFYNEAGELNPGMDRFGKGMNFVWGEATVLSGLSSGTALKTAFLVMGVAILLTTELGVLDVVSRISADIVKVNWLRDNQAWSESRLYFCFLWGEIALGSAILLVPNLAAPFLLLKISAAMNGAVMFVYAGILLYMNNRVLPKPIRMSWPRKIATAWAILFFGYFSYMALTIDVGPYLVGLMRAGE